MLTLPQSVRSRAFVQRDERADSGPLESRAAVRVVQVALAIYLLPAIVLVLAVASVGLLVVNLVHLIETCAVDTNRP